MVVKRNTIYNFGHGLHGVKSSLSLYKLHCELLKVEQWQPLTGFASSVGASMTSYGVRLNFTISCMQRI